MSNVLGRWRWDYEPVKDTFKTRFLAKRIRRSRRDTIHSVIPATATRSAVDTKPEKD